jgi:Putative DNA-binding domain
VSQTPLDRLELATLSEAELRQLIAAGETYLVERKEARPSDGFGPTIAAFANSGGGWLLLGVDNDGAAVGFAVPGRAEAQDWLRDELRRDVDPLPPFAARPVTIDGQEIVVVRVQASSQAPHLIKRTGVVYVREHGGKQPISSQASLLALTVKPEQAQAEALNRLTTFPLVRAALGPHPAGKPVNQQTRVADWIVSATPLTVPTSFRQRALSRSVVQTMGQRVIELLDQAGPPGSSGVSARPASGSGSEVEGRNGATGDEAHLLIDGGGVVVVRTRITQTRGVCHVGTVADDILAPLIDLALSALSECGALGQVHLHLHVRITPTAEGASPTLDLSTQHTTGVLHAPPGGEAFFGGDVVLPVEPSDRPELAETWMREIARSAGIDWWEPEP